MKKMDFVNYTNCKIDYKKLKMTIEKDPNLVIYIQRTILNKTLFKCLDIYESNIRGKDVKINKCYITKKKMVNIE